MSSFFYVAVLPGRWTSERTESFIQGMNQTGFDWIVVSDQSEEEPSFWWLPRETEDEARERELARLTTRLSMLADKLENARLQVGLLTTLLAEDEKEEG